MRRFSLFEKNPLKVVWMIVALLLLQGCAMPFNSIAARDGVLELSSSDICSGKVFQLKGNWRVFWNELLSGVDVAAAMRDESGARYFRMPGQWNDALDASGKKIGSFATATFALRVRLQGTGCSQEKLGEELEVYLREALTAYEFEVRDSNGTALSRVVSGGAIGTDGQSSRALYERHRLRFPLQDDLIFVWRISNFLHSRGGPVNPVDFGSVRAVERSWEVTNLLECVALGMILIICLYNLLLYLYARRDSRPLWLSLFCLVIAVRLVVTNSYVEHFYPNLDLFMPLHRLNVISVVLAPFTFYLYCRLRLDERWRRWTDPVFQGCTAFYTALGTFAPFSVYYSFLPMAHLLTLAVMFLAVQIEISAALKGEGKRYLFSMAGVGVLFLSALFELVSHYEILYIPVYTSNGLVVFLMFEAFQTAIDNQRSHKRLNVLARELEQSRGQIEAVLSATRRMAESGHPLGAVQVAILSLLKFVECGTEVTADVLFFNYDDRDEGKIPRSCPATRLVFGRNERGDVGLLAQKEMLLSVAEILAAVESCEKRCGAALSERRVASSSLSEKEIMLCFARDCTPHALVRVQFVAVLPSGVSLTLFVETLSESLSGILDNMASSNSERLHLQNLISLASSISDKLNSPLMAARNVCDKIMAAVQGGAIDSEMARRLERMSHILSASLDELDTTSKQLEALRDSDDVEPTKILSEENEKNGDANS